MSRHFFINYYYPKYLRWQNVIILTVENEGERNDQGTFKAAEHIGDRQRKLLLQSGVSEVNPIFRIALPSSIIVPDATGDSEMIMRE